MDILNDEEQGKSLLKRATVLSLDKNARKQNEMLGGKEGIASETPICIVDCDLKRLGFIRQVNQSFAKLFGYIPIMLED